MRWAPRQVLDTMALAGANLSAENAPTIAVDTIMIDGIRKWTPNLDQLANSISDTSVVADGAENDAEDGTEERDTLKAKIALEMPPALGAG